MLDRQCFSTQCVQRPQENFLSFALQGSLVLLSNLAGRAEITASRQQVISVPVHLKELLATASACTSPEKIFHGKSSNQNIDKNVKTEHSKRNSVKQIPAVAFISMHRMHSFR